MLAGLPTTVSVCAAQLSVCQWWNATVNETTVSPLHGAAAHMCVRTHTHSHTRLSYMAIIQHKIIPHG